MKIVWVGTHSSQCTGYANVTKRLTRELAALGASVHVYGVQGCGPSSAAPGVSETDAARLDPDPHGFGFPGLGRFVDDVAADAVVVYNDPVVIAGFLDGLTAGETASDRVRTGAARVFLYLDLVYDSPLEAHWETVARPCVAGVMVMSECWKAELARWPVRVPRVRVIPHAAEVPIVPREEARRALGWWAPETTHTAIGKDAVVFANMNRNTQRKRLDVYAAAAARFLARNAVHAVDPVDAVFLASSNREEVFDLHSVARRELVALGVGSWHHAAILDRIRINRTVLPDETVHLIHNACDVAVNCAEGEGFGLVPLEAASVGRAVIASAVGAMADVFGDADLSPPCACLVSPSAEYFLDASRDGIGGRARVVDVEDLTRAFELFARREARDAYGRRAMERVRGMPTWADIARTLLSFVSS